MATARDKSSQPILVTLLAPFLAILSFVYMAIVVLRPWLYRFGILLSESSGAFVVSVGNIQSGGTGKTPFTAFLVRRWRDKVRLGIVSRGYGRNTKGSLRVRPDEPTAALKYGDEPTWFAQTFRDVPVQVGERRVVAAQDLVLSEGTKLIVLDDGFQHIALRRSFDFVLVDVSAPHWHWRLLPWGRMRELGFSLRRADAIILSKTEGLAENEIVAFEQQVSRWSGSPAPVVRMQQRLDWPSRERETLVVAAGLADPNGFFSMVEKHPSNPQIQRRFSFADHHVYKVEDVKMLVTAAKEIGARRVLVTEKDAVKLGPMWPVRGDELVDLVISRLEVRPARESDEKSLERIDEIILGQVRSKNGTGGKLPHRDPTK